MKHVAFGVLALALPAPAFAITCAFDTVTPVSFGTYDVFAAAPVDATGAVWLTCTGVLPTDNVTVDLSTGTAGTFLPRTMPRVGGGTAATYNLFSDAGRTARWGDGTAGTGHYGPANPVADTSFELILYGRMPARQDLAGGLYADTIVATINF